ncbi:MAG: cephalosporin hydroxylase family protein [Actinomycetota bacterium]|nr:cephalosporin hydroxylase family protein [Actinomycetota bacterium]
MALRWPGRAARAAYRPFAPMVDRAVIRRFRQLVDRSVATGVLTPPTEDAVVASFRALYEGNLDTSPPAAVRRTIIEQFQRLYYHSGDTTWRDTWYRGVRIWKCPLDLWLYQEILHEVRPALIVETGTAFGGSAYFLADLCELMGRGHVVSIDILAQPDRPDHPRVTYLSGSSTAPEIVAQVRSRLPSGRPDGAVLVILDSDHGRDHVLAELRAYGPMVTTDSYIVVEDTNVNGHPVFPSFGPGPMEAVDAYLAETEVFVLDESKHKFLQTFNPRGYLRKEA